MPRAVEHVVILAADQIYRMDYMGMVQEHVQSGADVTIACTRVTTSPERAAKLGLMRVDEDGWVTDFAEKPQGDAVLRFAQAGSVVNGVRMCDLTRVVLILGWEGHARGMVSSAFVFQV